MQGKDVKKFKPIKDRVIIRPIAVEEEVKIGSIIVPEMAEKLAMGEVVAVGIGEYANQTGVLIPNECEIGQRILYLKEGAFLPLRIGDEHYLLMRESNIECILASD